MRWQVALVLVSTVFSWEIRQRQRRYTYIGGGRIEDSFTPGCAFGVMERAYLLLAACCLPAVAVVVVVCGLMYLGLSSVHWPLVLHIVHSAARLSGSIFSHMHW